jgi:hypothetical protein
MIHQRLTGTKHYENEIIRGLPESQMNCDSGGVCLPWPLEAQAAAPHG